jgi:hypothetical protein
MKNSLFSESLRLVCIARREDTLSEPEKSEATADVPIKADVYQQRLRSSTGSPLALRFRLLASDTLVLQDLDYHPAVFSLPLCG